jgi:predicted AlkP superfamily phosphohydrolase/phosphomutase
LVVLLHTDALNPGLVDRLSSEGRMPTFAEILRTGRRHELDSPATHFPAATYFSMHSGMPPGEHGMHFSFQWSAPEQRIRFRNDFEAPVPMWETLAAAGKRALVVDPYELARPERLNGRGISGWQFANILSLERWAVPDGWQRPYERRFGRSPQRQEVFGRRTARSLYAMRDTMLAASGRVADLTVDLLRNERFDFACVSLLAAHQLGHVFWDVSQLALGDAQRDEVADTLARVYEETDKALGRILTVLPGDADVIVVTPLGMGPNISRVEVLAEMLERVLSPNGRASQEEAGDRIWRLRAAVPTSVRSAVARALGATLAREVTAKLSVSGMDWSKTRAFLLPSDENGQIRVNLAGREREGIVAPEELDELLARISEGLLTFNDIDGGPCIASIERSRDVFPGERSHMLPDLVVRWTDEPASPKGVQSPRYGEVRRRDAGGTGRNGSHTPDASAVVIPGKSQHRELARRARVTDVAPTVAALLDVDVRSDAEPLLEPAR